MHAMDVLGDPTRRRIIELLAEGEQVTGDIVEVISDEFGLTQPAVSYQLKILRTNGFAKVRADVQRRLYSLDRASFVEVEDWVRTISDYWENKLNGLSEEVARGKKRES